MATETYNAETHLDATMRGEVTVPDITEESRSYILMERLGEGGMGVVFRARDPAIGRDVAIKQCRGGSPAKAVDLLQREARLTGRLEHPNIIPVHALVDGDDGVQLVMKKVEGVPWSTLMEDQTDVPTEGRADPLAWHLGVMVQVCRALEFAHDRGILHRDLKPDNVMVGAFGEVYLLDWGIAVSLIPDPERRIPDLTSQRGISGTPYYMAPEMFRKDFHRLSDRTDVFLIGAVLFELFAGRRMREGMSYEEIKGACDVPVEPPDGVPSDLFSTLRAALSVEPRRRPTARDMRVALQRHLAQRDALLLFDRTLAQVSELCALPPDGESARSLFGACRFGLQEVLARIPGHPEALAAQDDVHAFMVRHELSSGRPHAAKVFLDQMEHVSEGLESEVMAAVDAADAERERLAALEADLSDYTGVYARIAAMVILGVVWVLQPLVLDFAGMPRTATRVLLQNGVVFVGLAVIVLMLAPWLRASRLNRGVIALVAMSPIGGTVIAFVSIVLEVGVPVLTVFRALYDGSLIVLGGVLLDWRILPAGIFYVSAGILCAFFPAYTSVLLVSGTIFLVSTMLVVWVSRALRGE